MGNTHTTTKLSSNINFEKTWQFHNLFKQFLTKSNDPLDSPNQNRNQLKKLANIRLGQNPLNLNCLNAGVSICT